MKPAPAGAPDSSKATGGTALVVAAHGRRGFLDTGDGRRQPCLFRGRRLRVVCGDRVRFRPAAADTPAIVEDVLPRHNELARLAGRGGAEIIAANIDRVIVVLAPAPAPDFFLADRYLCAARLMDSEAAVAWNKADTGERPPAELDVYATLGYPVWVLSAHDGTGLEGLRSALGRGTTVLLGQSGVGKSSLLNALVPGATALTREISRATTEGRHTTTASVLHALPGGGYLADTPGVRDFVPSVPDARRIVLGFVEIGCHGQDCRFADCSHLREAHCAVQRAVAAGLIAARRYESYRRLMNLVRQAADAAY
jgi:ribosome biogenesis GTPase